MEFVQGEPNMRMIALRRSQILSVVRTMAATGLQSSAAARVRASHAKIVQARDLRVIDPSFSQADDPAMLVRASCVVLNLMPVRAVIMQDRVFFVPESGVDSDVQLILKHINGTDQPVDGSEAMPFELRALEAMLMTMVRSFMREIRLLEPSADNAQRLLTKENDTSPGTIELLRQLGTQAAELNSRLKAIKKVLDDLLDTPDALHILSTLTLPAEGTTESIQGAATADGTATEPTRPPPIPLHEQVEPPFAGPPDSEAATALNGNPAVSPHADGVLSQQDSVTSAPALRIGRSNSGEQLISVDQEDLQRAASFTAATYDVHVRANAANQVDGADALIDPDDIDAAVVHHANLAELLIECYLGEVEALIRDVHSVEERVTALNRQLSLVLAHNRNVLLRVDVGISVLSMLLACIAVVVGAYGMNVPNGLEDSGATFNQIMWGSTAVAVVAGLLLWAALRKVLTA